MEKGEIMKIITGAFILLFSFGSISVSTGQSGQTTSKTTTQQKTKSAQTTSKSAQTKTKTSRPASKSVQTKPKPVQKSAKPAPVNKSTIGTVRIGTQTWATVNLNVSTFRNGDSIPEAKTNKEWVAACEAGKPAWCYYNNNPAYGPKFGKLYNWYAVSDPRGLAPSGWELPGDADWAKLTNYLGGPGVAGRKIKTPTGWIDDNTGTNESGFTGLPGGYRTENGTFLNFGTIGSWWSSTESKANSAFDYFLALSSGIDRSSSPKQRGESVRCLRK